MSYFGLPYIHAVFDVAAWTARSPLGRLASPDDVANVACFLASDEASYLTGEAINVTGGMMTH